MYMHQSVIDLLLTSHRWQFAISGWVMTKIDQSNTQKHGYQMSKTKVILHKACTKFVHPVATL